MLLNDAQAAAESFVQANEPRIRRLADELLARGDISGDEAVNLLGDLIEPPAPADDPLPRADASARCDDQDHGSRRHSSI